MAERAYLSIGEVLALLKDEFPEITISKIRFLESQGLLNPERTPSGYRKFYEPDVERLRWILQQQRENFLPLKVIKGRLGMEPANGADHPETAAPSGATAETAPSAAPAPQPRPQQQPRPPQQSQPQPRQESRPEPRSASRPAQPPPGRRPVPPPPPRPTERRPAPQPTAQASPPTAPTREPRDAPSAVPAAPERAPRPEPRPAPAPEPVAAAPTAPPEGPVNLTRDELISAAEITLDQLAELEKFGLLTPRQAGGAAYYDADALAVARVAASFMRFGVEARHLRMYKNAAEREAGVFEQIVMPLMKQRNPDARRQAIDTLGELASLGEQLRAALLHDALREHTAD